MRKNLLFVMAAAALVVVSGCGPSGSSKMTLAQQKDQINQMANTALADFYQKRPSLRSDVQNATGYGVFSTANVSIIFATGGGGYGVVVDNKTGQRTYMRQGMGGLGIGLGAKDYRQLLIFNNQDALNKFAAGKWSFGGEAGAAAKSEGSGAAASGARNVSQAVQIYTLTSAGLTAEAMVTGTSYWPVTDLNASSPQQQQQQQPQQ